MGKSGTMNSWDILIKTKTVGAVEVLYTLVNKPD